MSSKKIYRIHLPYHSCKQSDLVFLVWRKTGMVEFVSRFQNLIKICNKYNRKSTRLAEDVLISSDTLLNRRNVTFDSFFSATWSALGHMNANLTYYLYKAFCVCNQTSIEISPEGSYEIVVWKLLIPMKQDPVFNHCWSHGKTFIVKIVIHATCKRDSAEH